MAWSLQFKGFNYTSYYNGAYEYADSLPALVATGANAAALNIENGIDVQNSEVYADTNYTDSLTALGDTIAEAVHDGLAVMVRPLIDFVAPSLIGSYTVGDWRDDYNPADSSAFFASYQSMIVAEARVAQANGANSLCIGTELDQLTGPAYLTQWTSIITAVRAVFTGKLTYAADWDDALSPWAGQNGLKAGTGDITTQVSFWSQLDAIGIDCYAPLSDAANPTLAQLVAGWNEVPTDATTEALTGNHSLISYFEGVAASIGKPMLFTEIGYENATDAASQPSGSSTNVADAALQARLYQAFFTAWSGSGTAALTGAYFWNWDPNAAEVGPGQGVNFSPQGLAAQTVVTTAFTACFAQGTRIATPWGEVSVESLAPGDVVATPDGPRLVRWVGHRHVHCAAHPRPARVWPVRIAAHSFGAGQPHTDLVLSPDHAVFVAGVLIQATRLVNGRSIVQERWRDVRYWHVEMERHGVLFAAGLTVESYLDTGNRSSFANGGPIAALHADFPPHTREARACARLVTGGAVLATVRHDLLQRALKKRELPRKLNSLQGTESQVFFFEKKNQKTLIR